MVAYINLDAAAAGSYLSIHASPSLADLLRNVTVQGHAPSTLSDKELEIGPLGSGVSSFTLLPPLHFRTHDHFTHQSDYTVFLQHLGIASSDMSYRGTKTDPVYQ